MEAIIKSSIIRNSTNSFPERKGGSESCKAYKSSGVLWLLWFVFENSLKLFDWMESWQLFINWFFWIGGRFVHLLICRHSHAKRWHRCRYSVQSSVLVPSETLELRLLRFAFCGLLALSFRFHLSYEFHLFMWQATILIY